MRCVHTAADFYDVDNCIFHDHAVRPLILSYCCSPQPTGRRAHRGRRSREALLRRRGGDFHAASEGRRPPCSPGLNVPVSGAVEDTAAAGESPAAGSGQSGVTPAAQFHLDTESFIF